MDLKSYIESEVEEEKALGYTASRSGTGESASHYPGDPDVYVDDAGVMGERLTLSDGGIDHQVYVARPAEGGRAPAVLVIHENKGLVPYIENVARRLAREGYVAVAPDLLSRVGGTGSFEGPNDVTKALGEISGEDLVADVRAVVSQLAQLDYVDSDRVGIIGFCFGGGVTWRALTKEPGFRVGVPFYGPIPELDAVPAIQAPVLAVYGELDERITSMLPDIQEAMSAHGKTFEPKVFSNAQHAFHNDTNPDRYNADAAGKAWDEAVAWLDRWLKKS
jgi:carboxymethylenebutenolidase